MFKSKYVKSLAASVILASALFMGTGAEASRNFTDLYADPSHTMAVQYLNQHHLYDYKADGKFNGNAPVSRAEAAKILYNLFGKVIAPEREYNNNFKDVNSNTQFYNEIVWAYEAKIFDGNGAGNFNPSQTLTRAQMAKILVNAYLIETDGSYKFKDVNTNHWAYEYISILGAEKISVGSNGNFMPEQKVTLNQLSTFIYRIEGEPPVTIAGTTPETQEQKLELKTPEEVLKLAVELWNSPEFQPESIQVLTTDDVDNTLRRFSKGHKDLSPYLNGYNSYGRLLGVSSVPTAGGYKTTIEIDNQWDEEQQEEYKAKIANSVEYIKNNYDTSTDYKTIKAIADFISSQLTYGESVPFNHKYIGWYGGGMCETYTNAVASILTSFGYDNRILSGRVNGSGHMFNAVNLDGNWYYIDVTAYDSDGQGADDSSFLVMTQSELENHSRANYTTDTDFKASNIPYNK